MEWSLGSHTLHCLPQRFGRNSRSAQGSKRLTMKKKVPPGTR